ASLAFFNIYEGNSVGLFYHKKKRAHLSILCFRCFIVTARTFKSIICSGTTIFSYGTVDVFFDS
ncbi:MAG: hypothetical protein WCO72_12820, partial [Betaproteobacteria bacterium]